MQSTTFTKIFQVRKSNDDMSLSDCAYVFPSEIPLWGNVCKIQSNGTVLILPLKGSNAISSNQIGLNRFQRTALQVAINEKIQCTVLDRPLTSFDALKEVTLCVKSRSSVNMRIGASKIKSCFLKTFNGHLLNSGHVIPLKVESEIFELKILDLQTHANKSEVSLLNTESNPTIFLHATTENLTIIA